MQDIGFVHYWWTPRLPGRRRVVRHAPRQAPGAPWWLRSLAATTLAEGGDRQSSRLMWEAIRQSAENDWLRNDAERRLLQLRAIDEIDALQTRVDRFTQRTGAAAGRLGRAWRAIKPAPLDPAGTPYELERRPRPAVEALVAVAAARRTDYGRRYRRHDRPAVAIAVAAAVRRAHRQLPERLHLPAAARPVDRLARFGLPAAAAARSRGTRTSRSSATLALARTLPDVPEPISPRYPIVEALTAAMFAGALVVLRPEPAASSSRLLFGCALIVLFAIDLEHHLLPNVITLPGIVVGFAFSFFTEPGWRRRRSSASLVGGGVLWLIAEGYYRIRHEEGLGMGDVKMLAMIGAFLGWKLTLVTLMMASFAGIDRRRAADRDAARRR